MSTNNNNDQPDSDSSSTLYKDSVQEMITGGSYQLSHDDQVHVSFPIMNDNG